MADQTVAEIQRNPTEKLIVQLRQYRGRWYIDARIHYLDEKDEEWKPTKKGLSLNEETSPWLREALEKAEALHADLSGR
jgi:hypothetical protein